MINIFIQARMSSTRFPGKVLSPITGKPLIKHLIDHTRKVTNYDQIVVLTSRKYSDDPLVSYLDAIGIKYFRGKLDNVFQRFRDALEEFPCTYFVRLCADSPFISSELIEYAISCTDKKIDLVSNVYSQTFPKGQSVEIVNSKAFQAIDTRNLDDEDREHVTPYFYKNPEKFNILAFGQDRNEGHRNMCIDTLEDYRALQSEIPCFSFQPDKICKKVV